MLRWRESKYKRFVLRSSTNTGGMLFLIVCFLIVQKLLLSSTKKPKTSAWFAPHHPSNDFKSCFRTPVHPLRSFDVLVSALHTRGIAQNRYETRFQEHVWHTIVNNTIFPTWYDYGQLLHLHSQALQGDFYQIRLLAESAVHHVLCDRIKSVGTCKQFSRNLFVQYAHFRIDRLRGLQFALHFRASNYNHAEYRSLAFSMLVQVPFGSQTCFVAISNPSLMYEPQPYFQSVSKSRQKVYILLPYHARAYRLQMFLENFSYLCTTVYEYHLVLVISVLRTVAEDAHDVEVAKKLVFGTGLSSCASNVHIEYNDGDLERQFSRSVAIRQAATRVTAPNNVVFQCDVDIHVHPEFFHRCVHNSIPGRQIYFPVFYSLYPYAKRRPFIMERNGFWRFSSFGMTCMRKHDFDRIGAFADAETRFHGWGGEDIHQFEIVRNMSGLVAFRAVDPALLHQWHLKNCDIHSDLYVDCMKTNFKTMGHPFRIGPAMIRSIADVKGFFQSLQNL